MKNKMNPFLGQVRSVIWLMICLSVFSCADPMPFPDRLTGRWVTDTEQYEDRYIEIDQAKIIFGTGQTEPNIFFINSFESRPFGKTTEWIFHCEIKKGESYTLNLLYFKDQDSDERIQLKNAPQILWHREEK